MAVMKVSALICSLLFIINGAAVVESARSTPRASSFNGGVRSLFVFGDSFADNGNLPRTGAAGEMTRQWYYPYGSNSVNDDGTAASSSNPTGRFSNYLVQSDFVAQMMGLRGAPPTYESTGNMYCDYDGMTFAVGGSGVFKVTQQVPTLRMQVDNFERLIDQGTITDGHLAHSVALVAVSGNDYSRVGVADTSSFGDVSAFITNVTMELVANVDRLQQLGVKKVLVNNQQPIGCAPSQTRANNYAGCDSGGNMGASAHNSNLEQLLSSKPNVLIVDLYSAFTGIVNHAAGKGSSSFKHKLTPCCESKDPSGYCGQMGNESADDFLYWLCDKPEKYFYWDDMHPTTAAWEAVMEQLRDPIKDFLDQDRRRPGVDLSIRQLIH